MEPAAHICTSRKGASTNFFTELGSEFDLDPNCLTMKQGNLFDYLKDFSTNWFDSGRSALRHLAKIGLRPGKILLPEFICESVIKCFPLEDVVFYAVGEDFRIDENDLLAKVDRETAAVFLMHYFGTLQDEGTLGRVAEAAHEHRAMIIEDATHSMLSSRCTVGDVVVSSVRKWLPVPRAGVLYSRGPIEATVVSPAARSCENRRVLGFAMKRLYLERSSESNAYWDVYNRRYRDIFFEEEKRIDIQSEFLGMSDLSRFIVSCFDCNTIADRRKANYRYLAQRLANIGVKPAIEISESDCPFVLPLRVNNRDGLRRHLVENSVYCAVHWPMDGALRQTRSQAFRNAETLISLPVDQRYEECDMDFLVGVIEKYDGELVC